MMTVTRILTRFIPANIRQTARNFHASSVIRDASYDGDGKTTLSVLNKDPTYGLMINSYSEVGFRLNNGLMIVGPLAIFPKSVLSWKVSGLVDISAESLSLFNMLEPKLDVLVIGIGSDHRTPEFDKMILRYGNKHKINLEIVPTNQACAVFNFLNAEGRFVGAGLLPPRIIPMSEAEVMNSAQALKAIDSTANDP